MKWGLSLGTISSQSLMENQFVLLSSFSQYNINLKIPIFGAFHKTSLPCLYQSCHDGC